MKRIYILVTLLIATIGFGQAQTMVNATYPHGNMPTGRDGGAAIAAYNSWKVEYITSCGSDLRVKFDNPGQTVSEGMAYGMLLAAYAQDRATLDGLTNYYNRFRNADGVMDWKIEGCSGVAQDCNGGPCTGGAADAEFDYAMALIVADKLWGSGGSLNYASLATDMIGIIKAKEITSSGVPRPGPNWGGDNISNPSYYSPAYFRVYGKFTGDEAYWNGVAAKCYEILGNIKSTLNPSFGLVPDWCTSGGGFSADAAGYFQGGTKYHYDAARTPWRMATDYTWFGISEAGEYLNQSYQFTDEKGGLASIVDGYNMDGSSYGTNNSATFSGAFATSFLYGPAGQAKTDAAYNYLVSKDPNGYFNTTLYVLYMYTMTGNFWNPMEGGPVACEAVAVPSSGTTTIQSEDWCFMDGVQTEPTEDNGGGLNVGFIDTDDWMSYDLEVASAGSYTISYRIASGLAGGELQIDKDGGATVLGTIVVPSTTGWQGWQTISHTVSLPQGNYSIGIKALTGGWNINWMSIEGGETNPTGNFLHTSGRNIVDADGNNVVLKAVNLTGWMVQEGYLLELADIGPQWKIRESIVDVVGEQNTQEFYDAWLDNMVTESDIVQIKNWGFNAVRVPLHYNLFTLPIQDEAVPFQSTFQGRGFELIDNLLTWCEANQVYVILDLHAAPGGQGEDMNISDRNPAFPSLWEDGENRSKTVHLWKEIASRYADNEWIAGYDLINETNWPLGDQNEMLRELYDAILFELRLEDNNHMVFIEGNNFANDFRGLTGPFDNNMVYSFHKYWSGSDQASIQEFVDMSIQHNVPLWCGETGENSNQWYAESYALLEANNIGYAFWPMKKLNQIQGMLSIPYSDGLEDLQRYWKAEGPKPSVEAAKATLLQLATNSRIENCTYNYAVIDAMTRQISSNEAIPYTAVNIPNDKIDAVHFNMGRHNVAYFDQGPVGNFGENTTWNNGWEFRNDAVDQFKDSNTGEYYVGGTEDNEWLDYTVNITESGTFDLNLEYASDGSAGVFHVEVNGNNVTGSIQLASTNGWENWQSITVNDVPLTAGSATLRLFIETGGFNIKSFEFSGGNPSNTVPVANAGSNQSVVLPTSTVTLSGSATDADGDALTLSWSQVSGPNNGSMASPSNASTTASGLVEGTYVFRLTADDNQAVDSDDVTVLVSASSGGDNMLTNGDFSNGLSDWTTFVGGSGSGSISNSGGAANAAIFNGGDAVWNIQLYQAGLTIENGETYTLSFEASASSNRSMDASVEHNGSPWTTHMLENVSLTTTTQAFSISFTASNATDTDGRVTFNMGLSNADVIIDNVVFKKAGDNPGDFTLTTSTNGSGTVTLSPAQNTYADGTEVTATAIAAAGWHFVNWSGDASGIEAVVAVTMSANKSITAHFEADETSNTCDNPITVSLPFSHTGEGEFCWVTDGNVDFINSWGTESVSINGVDITNIWINSLPARQDGNYYISFKHFESWAHLEITGSNAGQRSLAPDAQGALDQGNLGVNLFPNPLKGGDLVIQGSDKHIGASLQLLDINGRIVVSKVITHTQTTVSSNKLDKGFYLVYIKGSEVNEVLKLIVE